MEKKTQFIGIRITEDEASRLDMICNMTGKNRSDVLRYALQNIPLIVVQDWDAAEVSKLRIDVTRIGNMLKKLDGDFIKAAERSETLAPALLRDVAGKLYAASTETQQAALQLRKSLDNVMQEIRQKRQALKK